MQISAITSGQQWPATVALAQIVQASLAQIGVQLRLENLDPAAYYERDHASNFDMMFHAFGRANKEPATLFGGAIVWRPKENVTTFSSPQYTDLIARAGAELDPAKRKDIYRQIDGKPIAVGRRSALWRRLRRSGMGTLGLAVTGLVALVAVVGPMVYAVPPMTMSDAVLEPPSIDFPFGTDQFGRDVLSRTLSGLRISFGVGFAWVALGGLIVVSSGLVAGYIGGWFEIVTQRLWDGLMAFPGPLLGIAIAVVSGPGSGTVVLAAGLISVPFFSRLVRAQTLVEKNKDYVTAARCVGASNARILGQHVLPNCLSPILVQASVAMSQAMLLEAALSFLGLGVQPPSPHSGPCSMGRATTWARLIGSRFSPGLVLVLLLMAVNFLSDGLHEILLPRQS